MKQVIPYCLVFFLSIFCAQAQQARNASFQIGFQDSLRIVFENTKNLDAMAVGAGITSVWTSIGPDQQLVVKKQARLMRKKGYKVRPQIVNYFGALVDAINIEKIDPPKLTAYLRVAGQVIENESLTNASNFFKNSRDFFKIMPCIMRNHFASR